MRFRLLLLLGTMMLGGLSARAQTLTQTNLPIVVINTNGGTIGSSQIAANMKIINNGSGLNAPADAPQFQGTIGIRHRGSSANPKKSFNIETWTNSSGTSMDTSLLGMPTENDWVLLASYTDRSLMRNLLGFHLFSQMGNYAPRMKLVELLVNNSYEGVYLFGEKIKRDENRVDIATLKNTDNSGVELTGGYIFRIDNSNDDFWTSSYLPPYASGTQTVAFHYEEPQDDEITPIQMAYIKGYVDSFEAALNATNYQDTTNGWRKFAGQNSFQEYMVFSEVMKSGDAYRLSTYMYKDKDKKLRMGPPWDLEMSLYNTSNCNTAQDGGWAYNYGATCVSEQYLAPFWWSRLATDTLFMREAKCRYTMYRQSFLDTNAVWGFIDSISNLLNAQGAQTRNFQKWPIFGVNLVNEPVLAANHAEEVTNMKGFIRRRLSFLDGQWLTPGCTLSITDLSGTISAIDVFPNPTGGDLRVGMRLSRTANLTVLVQDVFGRTLLQKETGRLPSGETLINLATATLPAGVYAVTAIVDGTEKKTLKFVRQ